MTTDPALRALLALRITTGYEGEWERGFNAALDRVADEVLSLPGWERAAYAPALAAAEAAPLDVVSGDPSPKLRHVLECVDEYTRGWRDALAEHGRAAEAAPLDVGRLADTYENALATMRAGGNSGKPFWEVFAREYAALRSPDPETAEPHEHDFVFVGSLPGKTCLVCGQPDIETAGEG